MLIGLRLQKKSFVHVNNQSPERVLKPHLLTCCGGVFCERFNRGNRDGNINYQQLDNENIVHDNSDDGESDSDAKDE